MEKLSWSTVLIILILLCGVGVINESYVEEHIRDGLGLNIMEQTAKWTESYDSTRPIQGVIGLLLIFSTPTTIGIITLIRKRYF